MSRNQTARSCPSTTINFAAALDIAIVEYERVTGQRPESNSSVRSVARQLESCYSPEDITTLLRLQEEKFNEFRRGPLQRLLAQLNPTFHVLFTLSAAVGEVAGLVSHIRRSFGMTVLQHLVGRHSHPPKQSLSVCVFFSMYVFSPKLLSRTRVTSNSQTTSMGDVSNYDKLIILFERIDPFLRRVGEFIQLKTPLTSGLKELIERILAQILLIVALLINTMGKRWRTSELDISRRPVLTDYDSGTHLQRLVGGRDVEETLLWLDLLTNVENLTTLGRTVGGKHRRDVNCKVKATKHSAQCIMSTAMRILLTCRAIVSKIVTEDFRRLLLPMRTSIILKADKLTGQQLEGKLRAWLSPPDPFIDHSTACEIQHRGSATWFIQGRTFQEWKTQKNGSLLWIRGKCTVLPPLRHSFKLIPPPDFAAGSGKTILWCVVSRLIL